MQLLGLRRPRLQCAHIIVPNRACSTGGPGAHPAEQRPQPTCGVLHGEEYRTGCEIGGIEGWPPNRRRAGRRYIRRRGRRGNQYRRYHLWWRRAAHYAVGTLAHRW